MLWIWITVAFTGGKQWNTVAGRKHQPVCLAFVLYFSLFGNFKFISLPSQWHWWWSLLFQLKCVLKPAEEYVWQRESLVLLGPLIATSPSLVSLSYLEVTPSQGLSGQKKPALVVSMDRFVIMCPLCSALCVELGTSWQAFICLP